MKGYIIEFKSNLNGEDVIYKVSVIAENIHDALEDARWCLTNNENIKGCCNLHLVRLSENKVGVVDYFIV